MRRLGVVALLLLGAVASVGAAGPALAHGPEHAASAALGPMADTGVENAAPAVPPPADPVLPAALASFLVTWLPLLIAAAVPIGAFWSRRAVVGLLVAALAVLAFETGLHSVHHLGQERDAPRCVIESASSHLSGVVGEPMSIVGPGETADLAPCRDSVAPPRTALRPDRGRAPPFLA